MIVLLFFFFNDTATTEIYTLSLHDALPIWQRGHRRRAGADHAAGELVAERDRHGGDDEVVAAGPVDRKSTRLNSSHANISYAVFCLKKKRLIVVRACLGKQ